MSSTPKYSLPEIERRWLVSGESTTGLTIHRNREIEDKYIIGTRLRLRVVREDGREVLYKIGKKYEPVVAAAQQVVTTYLTEAEYKALSGLPAHRIVKSRLTVVGGSLDVYSFPSLPYSIFEVEFTSAREANNYRPPNFVGEEITGNSKYSGFSLAASEA